MNVEPWESVNVCRSNFEKGVKSLSFCKWILQQVLIRSLQFCAGYLALYIVFNICCFQDSNSLFLFSYFLSNIVQNSFVSGKLNLETTRSQTSLPTPEHMCICLCNLGALSSFRSYPPDPWQIATCSMSLLKYFTHWRTNTTSLMFLYQYLWFLYFPRSLILGSVNTSGDKVIISGLRPGVIWNWDESSMAFDIWRLLTNHLSIWWTRLC
jgi:hypothetical protein